MLKNLVTIILLICITAESPVVAALSVHDTHHDGNTSLHDYFHDVGQPHEHDEIDAEKFKISYSKEALEHNNSKHDGGFLGILTFSPTGLANELQEATLDELIAWWDSPFLKYTTPPPKYKA